ncbi:hypothetical protein HDF26_001961 [Pedobacter cryoconitis]|uniref:alpha-1,2-fucosyltransferase n=1 Tax=Pedobacter cryoconitis TaxID=188932 RepID=UPI00161C2592|nr:alpha-1,2-fucosyltransferase [Pedobacter cryoconitis]MBB6271534.1 hypothetical protein [Pedobacter cryoconitis]
MIIVKIWGGLGNQMFQYASAKGLSIKHNDQLQIDISHYGKLLADETPRSYRLDVFPNITDQIANQKSISTIVPDFKYGFLNKLYKIINKSIYGFNKSFVIEKQMGFSTIADYGDKNIYLDGYWQSEQYFNNSVEDIRTHFDLEYLCEIPELSEISKKIKAVNSISIHVRRGDYVTNTNANSYHGVCSLDYYEKAIQKMAENNSNLEFFVFSDDVDWCKHNLKIPYTHEYISTREDFHDLYLMSLCKHNIIANSSFSWWGAWLNKNLNKTVIAPEKWFSTMPSRDIIPISWLTI